ncbi:GHKL domain-containing protein [Paenibacillus tritici]|uniref:GHKL domain-containing protein n=1 Tax=Paenibacillus tritici TaxID=1873425 RepID=A0ABX2DUX0_9BACL|nr:ATP-binding protein [Paenibacillus tritici]NQX48488.1 GHKL domain-containing protein [Paenibacillus tritici]
MKKKYMPGYLKKLLISISVTTIFIFCIHIDLLLEIDGCLQLSRCLLSVGGIVLINIAVLHTYDQICNVYRRLIHQEIVNLKIKTGNHYYDHLENSHNEIRKLNHNMKNELLTVLGLLKAHKNGEAERMLENSLSAIKSTEIQKYTPNHVLNYLLTEKIKEATESNVSVCVHCLIPEHFSLNNDVIAIIFGNLLDNAIEACEKITDAEKKIDINIKYHQHQLYIQISNNMNPDIFDYRLQSTKKDGKSHGFGLESVKQIVNEYSGIFKIRTEGNRFYVNIILWDMDC